jgi:hypothetical protein
MRQHRFPVRMNTPQRLDYTFRDYDNEVIDLSDYTVVYLIVKMQGADQEVVEASFVSKPAGTVRYDGYSFDAAGEWSAQFKAQIGTGDALYGEPIRFKVVPNLDDLADNDLPEF